MPSVHGRARCGLIRVADFTHHPRSISFAPHHALRSAPSLLYFPRSRIALIHDYTQDVAAVAGDDSAVGRPRGPVLPSHADRGEPRTSVERPDKTMETRHSRKRILFVAAEAAFFVTHRLPLALAARDHGYDVHVATPRGRLLERIQAAGLPWHEVLLRRRTRVPGEILSVPDLVRVYWRVRPHVVHHVALKAVLYGTLAARIASVPAVVNAITGLGYGFDERRSGSLLGRILRVAFAVVLRHPRMRVIFQNVEDRDLFLHERWIVREQAVLIRGSGVATDDFTPATSAPTDPPQVVFASRLLASKGVGEFVDAARIVRGRGFSARFVIVGSPDPDNPETITAEALEGWRREGVVEIWGQRSDMRRVLRDASVFVLPTYYREGVPKVLVEAAASGVPAVTTNTPGCRDIVQHGLTGLLVPPCDSGAVAAAIMELLMDPVRRTRMGVEARRRAVAEFSLERVVHQTLDVYRSLITDG